MPSSKLGHYVNFSPAQVGTIAPVDSGMSQRAIGNLNHLADQFAQRRIGWVSPDPNQYFAVGDDYEVVTVAGFQRLWTSTPFDLHIRGDGESYRCRLRWRLYGNAYGLPSNKAKFRAVIGPAGDSESELFAGGPNTAFHEVDSLNEWEGWVEHGELLYLDSARVRRWRKSVAAINEPGGREATAIWLRCELSVWCWAADVGAGRLSGLQLDEYFAPEAP